MPRLDELLLNERSGDALCARGEQLYRRYFAPDCAEIDLNDALNAYACALEQSPDSATSLCGMARVFLLMGDYIKASQHVQRACQLLERGVVPQAQQRTVQYEAASIQGTLATRQGHWESASSAFTRAIQARPWRSSRVRFRLFETLWQRAFNPHTGQMAQLGLLSQALLALMSSLALLPLETERMRFLDWLTIMPRGLKAWFQDEMGNTDAALRSYLDLHADYPGLSGIGTILGVTYAKKGEPAMARYWFEKTMARHPGDLDAGHHLARLLEKEEAWEEMAALYTELARLQPANPHVWCNLGNAQYYCNDFAGALGSYQTAFHLGHDARWRGMVAQSMGNLHTDHLNNPQAAIACYEAARMLNPDDVDTYIQLGMVYFAEESLNNAELTYRQALVRFPHNPRLHSNLGYLRWIAGDLPEAMSHYEAAMAMDATYGIPRNNLGVIYLDMLGQVPQAVRLFEEAIAVEPDYALAWYNLGRAHSLVNQRLEAARCFHRAQALNHTAGELDNEELTARIQNLFATPYPEEIG